MPGKQNIKVQGPFVFVRYIGPLQVTSLIARIDRTGRGRVVSAANLLPMHPKAPVVVGPSQWEDSSSSHSSSEEDHGAQMGDPEDANQTHTETMPGTRRGTASGAGGSGELATMASQAQQHHKRQRGVN